MKKVFPVVFTFSFLFAGCQAIQPITEVSETISEKVEQEQQAAADEVRARIACQELCQEAVSAGQIDLDVGPCLSEEVIPDWVCDIAHSPRQEVDDNPANQCASFRAGQTHHFVELDGNCNTIKVR